MIYIVPIWTNTVKTLIIDLDVLFITTIKSRIENL